MRLRLSYILLILVSFLTADKLSAQDIIIFQATVEAEDLDFNYRNVKIYSYNNEKDAKAEIGIFSLDGKSKYSVAECIPDDFGDFKIDVQDTKEAVVLVWCEGYKPVILRKNDLIPNRKITLSKEAYGKEMKDSVTLEGVNVEDERIRHTRSFAASNSEVNGLMTSVANFRVPYRVKPNMRVVAQSLWHDRVDITDARRDTVFAYGSVIFNDKEEYRDTQLRRMDFDMEHDSMRYINSISKRYITKEAVVNANGDTVMIEKKSYIHFKKESDTVLVSLVDTMSGYDPDPSHPYPFGGMVQVVDYNTILYSDTQNDNGERRSPLKFLELKFNNFLPDSTLFYVPMSKTPNEHNGELRLTFNVGSSVLATNDSSNIAQLNLLRETLVSIDENPDRSLINVIVYGMASPEGNLASNKGLASNRAATVAREISRYTTRPVNRGEARVAPWEWVADSLALDGYGDIAQEIRDIATKYPGDIPRQNIHISKMQSYGFIKDKYLPKFRVVRYVYTERKNELKAPKLLLQDYRKDPKSLGRAEYWRLLSHITGDKELLKKVALDAYRNTRNDHFIGNSEHNNGHWAYAAALLAHAYNATDTIDMRLQEPFFEYKMTNDSINISDSTVIRDYETGDIVTGYINGPSMAANQLIMTLKQSKRTYKKLIPVWEAMISGRNNAAYDSLLLFSKCLQGDYIDGNKGKAIRDAVSAISVTNAVVLNLAVHDPESGKRAEFLEEAIADTTALPDNAVSDYLKSIVCLRKDDKDRAERYLASSFCKDIKKISIANNDRDLLATDESKYHVISNALDIWKDEMGNYIKKTGSKVQIVTEKRVISRNDSLPQAAKSDSTDSNHSLPGDSVVLVQRKIVTEMTQEEYDNHPFVLFASAIDKLTDNDSSNDIEATRNLYKSFDRDRTYLSIFNVILMRDINITSDKKLLERLRNIRDEYTKAA